MYDRFRPLLFRLDAERAHSLTLAGLRSGLVAAAPAPPPSLAIRVAGLDFPSPIGLAAGFDKNAEVPDAMLRLGFGFVEVGTITPRPQGGNPRPRVFRLAEDRAVINRLGFNNQGLEAAVVRLRARAGRPGIVGVNIGANRDSADMAADYVAGVRAAAPLASYVTCNISSPNTPGLRSMQGRDALRRLLDAVTAGRGALSTPLFVKVAPDLNDDEIADIAEVTLASGVDGLIVSNTTLARPAGLRSTHAGEAGGLSGAPLLEPSTSVLRAFARALGGKLPLIGVGGVASGADAYAKLRAGASLVQLYTGLVYGGPGLPARLNAELAACLASDGLASVADAVGADLR